ncbi:hypothetical protein B0H11DRAFT_1901297 [Mycena galericulata]|nr:hypothetical protein B0H11DRAFT_2266742 [Mycena galericulata]KAJ7509944.1 hypothetical protein B0H11DRAFT_1901297 [Mycena galericulata]
MPKASRVDPTAAELRAGKRPQAGRSGAAHREANVVELRKKARERMREHRQHLQEEEELQAEARQRARNASKAYRQKNAGVLAMRQRLRRRDAFEAKYGRDALFARDRREQDARDEKRRAHDQAKWARQEAETAARVSRWVRGE